MEPNPVLAGLPFDYVEDEDPVLAPDIEGASFGVGSGPGFVVESFPAPSAPSANAHSSDGAGVRSESKSSLQFLRFWTRTDPLKCLPLFGFVASFLSMVPAEIQSIHNYHYTTNCINAAEAVMYGPQPVCGLSFSVTVMDPKFGNITTVNVCSPEPDFSWSFVELSEYITSDVSPLFWKFGLGFASVPFLWVGVRGYFEERGTVLVWPMWSMYIAAALQIGASIAFPIIVWEKSFAVGTGAEALELENSGMALDPTSSQYFESISLSLGSEGTPWSMLPNLIPKYDLDTLVIVGSDFSVQSREAQPNFYFERLTLLYASDQPGLCWQPVVIPMVVGISFIFAIVSIVPWLVFLWQTRKSKVLRLRYCCEVEFFESAPLDIDEVVHLEVVEPLLNRDDAVVSESRF